MSKKSAFLKTLSISVFFFTTVTTASSAEIKPEPPKEVKPPYERAEALSTVINPHNQINDTGDVLWGTCVVCHTGTPDIKNNKNIGDVKLRFEEDPNQLCRNCHTVKVHPGSEGVNVTMSGYTAPDHLVVPPKHVAFNMKLSLKEIPMILPLDPKSGKIICATCHNPHEKGLLVGRADWGADSAMMLRSAGLDICQYCHRK